MALDSVVLLRVVYLVMATGLETFYSFTGKKNIRFLPTPVLSRCFNLTQHVHVVFSQQF